jgi:hypothetical protein
MKNHKEVLGRCKKKKFPGKKHFFVPLCGFRVFVRKTLLRQQK